MILVVDNYDSFTFNLVDYFHQLGLKIEVHRNDVPLNTLLSNRFKAIVLAPGPGDPKGAGSMMQVLDYYHTKIPVLGICLGHQAICKYFRGELAKAQKPMHGKISMISQYGDELFQNIPDRFNVVRYHSLICHNLSDQMQVLAETDAGEIMAVRHNYLPIIGLQFHPEAVLTQFGIEILRNWVNIYSLSD